MQYVMRPAIPYSSTIVQTILSVLRSHNKEKYFYPATQTKVCNQHLPYVLDELRADYGVKLDPLEAINSTVQQIAGLVQREIACKQVAVPSPSDVHALVVGAIDRTTHLDRRDLQAWKSFSDDLCLDSLTVIDIAVQLQEDCNVTVTYHDILDLRTIAGLESFVAEQLTILAQ
jgi:acyl carrier protein